MPDITQIQVGSTTYDIRDTNVTLKAPVILSSASGSIASFTDGSASPVTALSVSIEPVQDLHGYDNPWPAGGGKNLLKPPSSGATINGVTFTVNSDGTITANGTAGSGSNADFYIVGTGASGYDYANIPSGNYIINGNDDIGSITGILYVVQEGGTIIAQVDYVNKNTNVTLSDTTKYRIFIRINAGKTVSNAVFKPMIRLASVSDATFAPYENICPITGRDEAVVTRTGKNLIDISATVKGYYDASGAWNPAVNGSFRTTPPIPVKEGDVYISSYFDSSGTRINSLVYSVFDKGGNFVSQITTETLTIGNNTGFIRCRNFAAQNSDMVSLGTNAKWQLEKSSTATSYEPYQAQQVTIDLDGTRYGGELNVLTGEMVVDRAMVVFDGANDGNRVSYKYPNKYVYNLSTPLVGNTLIPTPNGNTVIGCLSDYFQNITDNQAYDGSRNGFSTSTSGGFAKLSAPSIKAESQADMNAWLAEHPVTVVYPLATPITVQLTPSQMQTLLGENHIWADTGDVEITYRADTKQYVDEHTKNYNKLFYVKGTQTASTNNWTGNLPDVDELYEGLIIDYWLPFAGTSSGATLTLTLKDGVSSGAINMYYGSTTRLTTHLPALYVGQFIYQTVTISGTNYTGWWMLRSYLDGNTTDIVNLYQGSGAYQANSAVYRYQLLFQMDENKLTPLNNNNNVTGTTKTMLTDVEFDPFGYIFYYNSTTTVNANGNMTTTLYYQRNGVDLRYTFNCGQTLTAHKMLYLVLSLQSNGKVKIANATPWTHDLPTTNDGYLYLLLGRTYSTYQFALFKEHPIYYHNGTDLIEYTKFSKPTTSTPGLMLEAPSDDNEYMRKNSEWTKPLLGNLAFMNSNNGIEIFMITK